MSDVVTAVSIILPTKNERGNLEILIPKLLEIVGSKMSVEVIVVDDASDDGTDEIVASLSLADDRIRLISRVSDFGLASALRRGVEEARGDSVVLMDADTTHNPSNVLPLLHILEHFEIASASRFCAGGSMQGRTRYLGSYLFNLWIRVLLRTQIQDNLAGFFAMRRKALMSLPMDFIFRGYGEYFFRLLYLSRRRGFTIVEIPANYTVRPYGRSKSSLLLMVFKYTRAAIELKMRGHHFDKTLQ